MPPPPLLLLVDDNEDDIALVERVLDAQGLTGSYVVARNGAEALDYLFARGAHRGRDRRKLPAVVLMDLNLPRLSGIEALRAIRGNELTRLLPVVIFSTSTERHHLRDAYLAGANSCLRKPVSYGDFESMLRQVSRIWLRLNVTPPDSRAG